MPFFRRKQKPPVVVPPEPAAVTEVLQRRAGEILYNLRRYRPREFETLLSEVEHGHIERARLLLLSLGDLVEQAYIEPILQQLQAEVATSRASMSEALEENPRALRILLRSGNRQEAIELYQKRTGVDWQMALDAIKDLERRLTEEDEASSEQV